MRNFKTALFAILTVAFSLLTVTPASAIAVTGAVFSGGAGTATVGTTLYAKQGATLTLAVTTLPAKCVVVDGAFAATAVSGSERTSWTFTTTAGSGDGVRTVTVAASPAFNGQNNCTGSKADSSQASYVLDNTGPVVTGAVAPMPATTPGQPNAAGWFNVPAHVQFSATDAGAGGVTFPAGSGSTVSGGIHNVSATALDRLGNSSTGTVQVKVDRVAPTITATQSTVGADTTVTFTCVDSFYATGNNSGIASCQADGTTSSSVTISGNGTVRGTAADVAGNVDTLDVVVENVDTTAPDLSGAPSAPANENGWYRSDVTVDWTASDPESGIPAPPGDTTISGEGEGLTSTKTVTNGAGLSTTATSNPAVKIDRTPPSTALLGATNAWTNGDVVLTFDRSDNLSGADFTTYTVDGGAPQQGTRFTLSSEGVHEIAWFSTDRAGNVEAPKQATVRIDKTAPTITAGFLPDTYASATWTNRDVTVTFTCADTGGSTLVSCTDDVPVTSDGTHQVNGTATDGAGSSASTSTDVFLDKAAPSIEGSPARTPDHNGWYNSPVAITFTAVDQPGLSGIATAPGSVTLGEGANQSVTRSAVDNAGNSASATVGPLDVDLTEPHLAGTFAGGWHNRDVAVHWECADDLSGPAGQPVDSPVTGEGADLSATETCEDVAGNATMATVRGIRIDRTPPTTSATLPAVPASGWYDGDVEVTLAADDNLSGVATTYYTVDGEDPQTYEGPFSFGREGTHEISYWSVDVAGNVAETGAAVEVRIDKTAPETTLDNPLSPDSGWFVTSGIPFAFSATDGEDRSGIAATYFTIDGGDPIEYGAEQVTRDLSTGRHTGTYWSVDLAGNVEEARSFQVNVDTVPPTITGTATPPANTHGWNNTDVQVSFTCSDDDSGVPVEDGVVTCGPDATLANEGAGQFVVGHATDLAGNASSATVDGIRIDTTRPTLQGVLPDADGGDDWYRGDVEVGWQGDDALSQIDPATQPMASTITGEGRNLGAGPVTIFDKAGNQSHPATVSGVKIDRTAPQIYGAPTRSPDSGGWYNSTVTVDFTCADPLLDDGTAGSDVATCPAGQPITADGPDQSVTSAPATDVAGNERAGITVDGIDVDSQAPVTTADNRCTRVNDWCTGGTADVVLTATDQDGLSGVKEIHYRIDDGAAQTAVGDTTTVRVPLDGTGAGTVSFWAVDVAGNREATKHVPLKWDNLAPVVTHTLTPTPNAGGWNKSDVTVHFDATDEGNGSGVVPGTITADVLVSAETPDRVVSGSATDTAGNTGRDSATVRLDKTAPGIAGTVTAGRTGTNGWYTGPVTVAFTCDDALSGVATCTEDVILTANGAGQSTSGSAADRAGNTSSAAVSGIRIDQEHPTLTAASVNLAGGHYTLGDVPTGACTASDGFSGVASCVVTVTGGNANGVGVFDYTATATDNAGNRTVVTGTYRVVYGWSGYLQPINDTAHQVGLTTSVFKAGSTVPVKFQLKDAAGRPVQAATAPRWMAPVQGSGMTAPVDETAYATSADSGSTFRWDAMDRQYVYNWKTGRTGGNFWRIGVTLDDGQTYFVNIGLR